MRVAVVTNILTPYRVPLFEAINARVEALHVFTMAEREENRDWRFDPGSFHHAVLPGVHVKWLGAEVSLHVNYGVMRALGRMNPDVVLSGGFAPANLAAWLYCRINRRPFVGWGELSRDDMTRRSALRKALRTLLIRWSDGAIASSSEAREVFAHFGVRPEAILTSIMPVDVERFHAGAVQWRNSAWYQDTRKAYPGPILLSVGRLTERKGYRELFEIYDVIQRKRPDVSLIIVGDGPERSVYEAQVQTRGWKRVEFAGFCQADEVVKFLALADLFVFHTLSDPFGAVLSEAMAAELPVAASVHAAATRDLVDEGTTGFHIDPRDAEGSAGTILRILSMTPGARSGLGRSAYIRARRHGIAESADTMVGFLNSIQRLYSGQQMPVQRSSES